MAKHSPRNSPHAKRRLRPLKREVRLFTSRRRMRFESLEERVMLDSDLSAQLQNIIRNGAANAGSLVDVLHDRLFERVLHRDQPLIGNALQVKDTANDKLNALSTTVQNAIQTFSTDTEITSLEVKNALTTALNTLVPTGALQSFTILHTLASPNEVRYAISLTGTIVDRTVPFNLGLNSVFTTLSGDIHVGLKYTAQITVGFSSTAGVFLDTTATDDFVLDFDVTSPNLNLGVKMGILKFQAQNNATGPATGIDAQFKVQLANDSQLTVSEMFGLGVTANLQGAANVNLKLSSDLGDANLPSLSTTLLINWQINESPDVALSGWGDAPTVKFGGISVSAGSFMDKLVRPIFEELDAVLTPVKPVLDVLSARMPVLSDIAGEDVTLADVIADLSDGDLSIIAAVADFYEIYQQISSAAFSGEVKLGAFDIGAGVDVRGLSTLSNLTSTNIVVTQPPAVNENAQVASFLASTNSESFDGGFVFPLLEQPGKVFDLLLGKDIEFFRLDLPVLTAGFEFSLPQIPIFPPLGIKISGRFDIGANLGFGYDSSGLRRWSQSNFAAADVEEVFDGFFIRDRVNGQDIPELFVQARIQAAADISVGIASVGVGGAIIATIGLDVRDRNADGRVHPSEIALNISELGPLCGIFQHTGSLDAALTAYVEVGVGPFSVGYSYDIISVRLIDFEFPCIPGGTPSLAEYSPATGQLTLNTGPRAHLRYANIPEIFRPAEPDMDETYIIRKIGENEVTGADIIEIKAFGYTEVYGHDPTSAGVTSIIGDGGKGNDILQLSQSVKAAAYLSGGSGNDKVIGGSGGGVLYGDGGAVVGPAGDDEVGGYGGVFQIYGGGGNDLLHGGGAADIISGGDGDDTIFGNGGDDNITGGEGKDLVVGGIGNDTLAGDGGDDDIRGEDGNDTIYGYGGNDILRGGEGDNIIYGGVGDDLIHSLGGVDTIYGEAGLDKILAGDGADNIYGGADADEIYGEGGNDQIFGEGGDDLLHGDAGSDTIHGNEGHDTIYGDDDHDFLYGDEGNDTIEGGAGDDDIYGNAGLDTLRGNTGRDRIWGGTENDTIYGDQDSDALYGEQGDDTLSGGDGDDLLEGGIGNDTLSGDAGIDRLYGGVGDDTLYGHAFLITNDDNATDYLYGEAGNDTAYGNGGDDVVDGGAGVDNLYGGAGNDSIIAGTGIGDHLYGEAGDDNILGSDEGADTDTNFLDATYFGDWIDGGSGNDTINSLGGADYIQGGDDDDWINSGFGVDWIRGGAGNDYLYAGRGFGERIDGEDGDDTIYGSNEGADTLSGNAGQDKIYGQGGNDTIFGNDGDDHLDGGTGVDIVSGGLGNDTLYGGGGVGDQLSGDDGSDNIYGSDDGADIILGGAGRDTIYGRGGNDSLAGGAGDDIIDGGAGDDTISGDAGSDILLGGANHDTIYGHSVSGAGDDNSVDYVYGDFGTDRNEAGSGRDRLFGQGGNDLIWGEGDDDFINVGGGASNQSYYGAGESGTPSDFVTPTPTPAPTVQTVVGITHAAANLPTGIDTQGRWSELAGSGSYDGFSQSPAGAIEPSIAVTSTGITFAAWVDARHGNFEIYVAKHTPGVGWQELAGGAGFSTSAGSASEGGISNTAGSSRRPTITIGADGQPLVAWTEFSGSTSNIRVAKFDPAANAGAGGWVALGTSLGAGGISGTGAADFAAIVNTAAGPVVAWLDSSSGTTQVYARQFSGGTWSGLGGAAFASGTGVSQAASSVTEFALATDGTKVAIGWSAPVAGGSQVFLRELSGGTWNALAGSATGGGVSGLAGNNRAPSVAYHSGTLYVAWQGDMQIRPEIYVKRFTAGAWQNIGDAAFGVSATKGAASQPRLVSGGGQLHLVWADDSIASRTGANVAILATKWNGTTFAPEFGLDARSPALATATVVQTLALAVNASGKPYVTWSAPGTKNPQAFLLANTFTATRVFTADASTSVQSILDSQDLNPGDVIALAAGTHGGFTIVAQDSGVTILGVPGASITGPIVISGASDVTLQGIATTQRVSIVGGSRNAVVRSAIGVATLDGTTDAQLINNVISGAGVEIAGSIRPTLQRNSIASSADGIRLRDAASTAIVIRQNRITAAATGIALASASTGTIIENAIDGGASGLNIQSAFTGRIDKNDIFGAAVGVIYNAAASLSRNRIHDNTTGVQANVAAQATAFGFVAPPTGSLVPNEIYANAVGVALAGLMQWQNVHHNQTGVQGAGSLVAVDFEHANVIESNTTGVDIAGSIQFNRIARNNVGIAARNDQLIAHNLIYRNTSVGIQLTGDSDVRIVSNTLHSPVGDLVRIEGGSSEVQLTNNIFWAETGYDIFVADDSQSGFWSDYNLLHAGDTGKLIRWSGYDFTDVLDWQADVAKFDLHSRGRTVVNPTWSEPRFRNMGLDDYRTSDLAAGLRASNPAIDAGDPLSDLALATAPPNLLTNASFENGLTGWTTNAAAGATTAATAFDATRYFNPGAAVAGFAEQTVNLLTAGFSAAELDSRNLMATFSGRIRSASEAIADLGKLTLHFYGASDNLLLSSVADATNTMDRWELVGARVQIPVGTRYVVFRFDGVRSSGANTDSFLDAASLRVHNDRIATDVGASGNTYQESPAAAQYATLPPHIALRYPDLYTDWERGAPHAIRWETYGNSQHRDIRIDLYQDGPDGPTLLTTLAAATPDDGEFVWTPENNSIAFGTKGLRIQVQLVGDTIAVDRSTETFSVPENTTDFFVNDRDGSATAGNNRSTGKLANAPKPFVNNVIRIYTVAPTHTVHVDAGNYAMFSPLVIANVPGIGDDEGFVMSGPTAAGQSAVFRHANPTATTAPIIELNDADFVTMDHVSTVGGTYGLLVRNDSNNFVGKFITTGQAGFDGVRIESTVAGSRLENITSSGNGRFGISVQGPIDSITDSDVGFNNSSGIDLYSSVNTGITTRLEANRVHDNRGHGIFTNIGSAITIGNANLALARGNIVRDNAGTGILSVNNSNVLIAGNTVSGHRTVSQVGIYTAGVVTSNVVFDNYIGIDGSGTRNYNRIFNNAQTGLNLWSGSTGIGNISYGNKVGIYINGPGATLTNNLVYGNSEQGILLNGGGLLANNTIVQTQDLGPGDAAAINLNANTSGLQLRNNVIVASVGYGVIIPASSQNGFLSDFNLIHAMGDGKVGLWQNATRATLGEWQNATFGDQNSLSQDPQFVGGDDYHERSLYGSFRGGSLAPIISGTSGLPIANPGTLTADGSQSPAIDRGNGADSFANEPAPNGGFINLGAYGNTSQASLSPSQYVLVMRPDGGETWPAGQSFPIRWRSHNFTGDVRVELLTAAGAVALVVAASTPNDGELLWSIPAGFTPGNYRVRVTRLDAGSTSDTSNGLFSIPAPVHLYYVNDATVGAGDWTTAPGNDANDGLTPATPKATIRALLEAYDLGAGDTIRVDAGTYNLTANIPITDNDSGVRIEGFHTATLPIGAEPYRDDRTLRAVLNRGNTAGGSYVFQFLGADDVTLSHLGMTGAEWAVVALAGADSDRITVESSEIYANRNGMYFDSSNEAQRIVGNRIFDNLDAGGVGINIWNPNSVLIDQNAIYDFYFGTGMDLRGSGAGTTSITNNIVYYTTTGISAGSNATASIIISGNNVHDNRFTGIFGGDWTTVVGNTVHDTVTGISARLARNNIVYNSQIGIEANSGTIEGNRVFNNSRVGIATSYGTVQGNTVYSNHVGIRAYGTAILNNLIYDNENDGIWLYREGVARVENNTIYETGASDAIQLGGNHPEQFIGTAAVTGTIIKNNILRVDQGYALNFAPDSGAGSSINFNNYRFDGTGKLARWLNRDFTSLDDWYLELGFDQNSRTNDPLLVDPNGPDDVLGYDPTPVGAPVIVDNGSPGFNTSGAWQHVSQSNGAGGDFVETGFNNGQTQTATWRIPGVVGYPPPSNLTVIRPVSAFWAAHPNLGTATYTHTTTANYVVTYRDSQGNLFDVPGVQNFSGTIGSLNQALGGAETRSLGDVSLTFANIYSNPAFVSVTPVSLTTTLRIASTGDIIADSATIYGNTVDDGDAAFTRESGIWSNPGRDGDYHVRPATERGTASWEFTGLTPGAYYDLAALWTAIPLNSNVAEFSIFDGDLAVRFMNRDLNATPTDFTDAGGVKWSRLGVVKATGDRIVVKLSGTGKLQADAIRLQEVVGDQGLDDNFYVSPASPTIDAGDPTSAFNNEPASSGGRINLGHTGNTAQATTSPAQFVQVLSPNGLERYENGQQVSIQWRSNGIPASSLPNALLTESPLVYYRFDETTGTTATDSSGNGRNGTFVGGIALGATGGISEPGNVAANFDGNNDEVTVPSPNSFAVPQLTIEAWVKPDATMPTFGTVAMKSSSSSWNDGYGLYWNAGKLRFFVNNYNTAGSYVEATVPTGAWSHVAATYDGATLKIYANGILLATSNYSTPITHSTQPLQVGRGAGGGYFWKGGLDEVAVYGTALNASQINTHFLRQSLGNATVELVNETTSAVTVLAASTVNAGEFTWTIPANLPGGQYRVRVTAAAGIAPSDLSDGSFIVTNPGNHYYVNDSSLVGDVFTSAVGNNANDGKSPSKPMASVAALLAAYDLDAGDVIHVDAGTYNLLRNIVIDAGDAGVRIEGPGAIGGTGEALFNRGSTVSGAYVFEIKGGVDDVTLDHLAMTGSGEGVVVAQYSDSDRITLTNLKIFDNARLGIYVGNLNDNARVENSLLYNNRGGGIYAESNTGIQVIDNVLHHNSNPGFGGTGISVVFSNTVGNTSLVAGNETYNHDVGISVSGSNATEVRNNLVHHNYSGIAANGNVLVVGNTAHTNQGYHWSIGYGLSLTGSTAVDNVVYDNDRGIDTSNGVARNNRIYHNRDIGIQGGGTASTITGNTIYSQNLGIRSGSGDVILNNLIYDNVNDGIWVTGSGVRIENNTIYQPSSGDAIQIGGPHPELNSSSNPVSSTTIKNNILRVAQGYALNFAADSEAALVSDYNGFVIAGTGKLIRWEDRDFTLREDWFYELGYDAHSIVADPLFVDVDGPDNKLGYDTATSTNFGNDDNFKIQVGSLTIDAGDPNSAYGAEPGPNGGRVNLGHTGATADAATSPAQVVQVLSPNGLEKLEQGQVVTIDWRSVGIAPANQYSAGVLADNPSAYYRLGDPGVAVVNAVAGGANGTYIGNMQPNAGGALNYDVNGSAQFSGGYVQLPSGFANFSGGFTAEMWVNPSSVGSYQRLFDFGNGQQSDNVGLARVGTTNDLRLFALSGGTDIGGVTATNVLELNKWQHIAVTISAAGAVVIYKNGVSVATGNIGMLRNITRTSNFLGRSNWGGDALFAGRIDEAAFYDRVLPAADMLERFQNRTFGDVKIEVERVGSGERLLIAAAAANTGQYQWTVPETLAEGQYRIRVTANQGSLVSDSSDTPFSIVNGGNHYYVNDNSLTNDLFTTAVGNNANSGKSASQPMASLNALIAAYDLDPGDVVHVDTGTYRVYENMRLLAEDSGVRFEGPGALAAGQVSGATATITRGLTLSNQAVFEFAGADDVTLDYLNITGGNIGIWAPTGAGSDRITVSNSNVFNNTGSGGTGIAIGQSNRESRLLNNKVFNNTGNGIYMAGPKSLIEGNETYGQATGIYSDYVGNGVASDGAIIRNNIVRNNSSLGIRGYDYDQIVGNTVFGHAGTNAAGIDTLGSDVLNNTVYGNYNGILTAGSWLGETKGNRIYGNSNIGLYMRGFNNASGNQVYNNAVGIYVNTNTSLIASNLVYGNTNQGILVESSSNPSLVSNTVYQAVGDAVRLRGNNNFNVRLRNNILWVDSGYTINVDAGSQSGFTSNYNLLYQSTDPNAHVGLWGGVIRDSLAEWQAANSQDANSVTGDPLFVDRDGSDNVFGYRSSDGYDGGRDDNFILRAGSPAIDRGDGSTAPALDFIGAGRFDDPGTPNVGTPAGLPYVDLGAFEFRGSSLDVTPATITGTSPATIHTGTATAPLSQITINLSEPINSVDATAAANYQLRNAGVNGTIGDSDDVIIPLTATYTPGSTSILLTTAAALPAHTYRLTIFGTGGRGLHDLAGIVFDGNNDGSAGGDYVRTFAVQAIVGDYNGDNTINSGDYNFWKQNFGATSGPGLRADGNNDGVVDAADYTVWRDAFGNQGAGAAAATAPIGGAAAVAPNSELGEPIYAVAPPASEAVLAPTKFVQPSRSVLLPAFINFAAAGPDESTSTSISSPIVHANRLDQNLLAAIDRAYDQSNAATDDDPDADFAWQDREFDDEDVFAAALDDALAEFAR